MFSQHSKIFIVAGLISSFIVFTCLAAIPQESEEQEFPSVEERRLHAKIEQERLNILNEKKELELRKNELKTLEVAVDKKLAEIDVKLAEMRRQKAELDKLLSLKDAEEQKKIINLGKIYDKMEPEKAALALSGLDQRLAADILASMKVKTAAKVLDSLNKQKATELSRTFSSIQLE